MAMDDWVVANYADPTNPAPNAIWVYKTNAAFPNLHFSFSVDNPSNNHVATNAPPASSYYYGANPNPAARFAGAAANMATRTLLQDAWRDYHTV